MHACAATTSIIGYRHVAKELQIKSESKAEYEQFLRSIYNVQTTQVDIMQQYYTRHKILIF